MMPEGSIHESFQDAPLAALSPDERAGAAQVARRLAVELRALVSLLPKEEQSASAMARALGIDRNTCQRLVAALGSSEPNEAMLVRLPGVQGLRQAIDAVKQHRSDPAAAEQAEAALAAVEALDELIRRMAGSQRRLRQRLEADIAFGAEPRGPGDDIAARRALFRSAAEIVGRWSDTAILMSIIRPVPSEPELTETVRVQGRIGHVWRGSAVPLELAAVTPDNMALPDPDRRDGASMSTLGARPARGDSPDALLRPFCSEPLPRVTSRVLGKQTIHVVDPKDEPGREPLDLVMAHRRATPDRHPATMDPPIGEVSSLVVYPARKMVTDVYLHRDIAHRCVPSAELHLGGFSSGTPGRRARWSTRFPGDPTLMCLGGGLSRSATPYYERHAELTQHVFERIGWDPEQFIGYRCEVQYPVWQAAYCMLFDFGAAKR